jgi:hypothetical protein
VKVPVQVDFRTEQATLSGGRYYSNSAQVPAQDTTPSQFTFTDQTGVTASSTRTSNTITVAGLGTGVSATFTVTGSGGIDKNGSGVYASSQSLQNGDTFRAQHTASGSALGQISTTVTCNGITDTFTSTAADGVSGSLFESSQPLEVLMPKAAGSALVGLDSNNRIFRAYPGIPYRIPLCAIGGKFPYEEWTTTLGTIESYTDEKGETQYFLEVANPTANFAYTVTVDDGTTTANSGTVNVVVSATGFYFISPSGSDSNNGAIGTPFLTGAPLQTTAVTTNAIAYWRTGTYTTAALGKVSNTGGAYTNGEERAEFSRCIVWMAYPGEAPVIDIGYVGTGYPYDTGDSKPRLRLTGPAIWVEGLRVTRAMTMAFQVGRSGRRGVMFWRNTFEDCGPGIDGGNSAFIMWIQTYGSGGTPNTQAYGDCVISNSFDSDSIVDNTVPAVDALAVGPMITYSMYKCLFEGNNFQHFHGGAAHFAQKADVSLITFRGNLGGSEAEPLAHGFFGGNQDTHNEASGELCSGDICFNLAWATDTCLDIGMEKLHTIGFHNVRRNTFIGPIRIGSVVTADGIYTLRDNVFQNADGAATPWNYVQDTSITDATRVDVANNTVGASGVVNSSGNLEAAYAADVGTRGHQRSA